MSEMSRTPSHSDSFIDNNTRKTHESSSNDVALTKEEIKTAIEQRKKTIPQRSLIEAYVHSAIIAGQWAKAFGGSIAGVIVFLFMFCGGSLLPTILDFLIRCGHAVSEFATMIVKSLRAENKYNYRYKEQEHPYFLTQQKNDIKVFNHKVTPTIHWRQFKTGFTESSHNQEEKKEILSNDHYKPITLAVINKQLRYIFSHLTQLMIEVARTAGRAGEYGGLLGQAIAVLIMSVFVVITEIALATGLVAVGLLYGLQQLGLWTKQLHKKLKASYDENGWLSIKQNKETLQLKAGTNYWKTVAAYTSIGFKSSFYYLSSFIDKMNFKGCLFILAPALELVSYALAVIAGFFGLLLGIVVFGPKNKWTQIVTKHAERIVNEKKFKTDNYISSTIKKNFTNLEIKHKIIQYQIIDFKILSEEKQTVYADAHIKLNQSYGNKNTPPPILYCVDKTNNDLWWFFCETGTKSGILRYNTKIKLWEAQDKWRQ